MTENSSKIYCQFCNNETDLIITSLFDDRFGAPGVYDIRQCRSCGLQQTYPQPGEQELKELYERFYNWGGEDNTKYTRIRERFMSSALYNLWVRWDGDISFHMKRGSGQLLDIGCNEGRSLSIFAKNGFHPEGLELNEVAAAAARAKGFPVYTVPATEFAPRKPYDVVVLSNVLEHVPAPVRLLQQIRGWLSPKGEIWVSCPNVASIWRVIFGRHWINWHVPFHLWHFSPINIKNLFYRANLQVVEMHTCTPALWLAQSFATALINRKGRTNQWLRSAPVIVGLMLAARGVLFHLDNYLKRQMSGDCLIVTGQPLKNYPKA